VEAIAILRYGHLLKYSTCYTNTVGVGTEFLAVGDFYFKGPQQL